MSWGLKIIAMSCIKADQLVGVKQPPIGLNFFLWYLCVEKKKINQNLKIGAFWATLIIYVYGGGHRGVPGTEKPLEISVKTVRKFGKNRETANCMNVRNQKTASNFWENRKTAQNRL